MRTAQIGEAITVAVLAAKKCGEVGGVTRILPKRPYTCCFGCSGELKDLPRVREVVVWFGQLHHQAFADRAISVLVELHHDLHSNHWYPYRVWVYEHMLLLGTPNTSKPLRKFSWEEIYAELYESSPPTASPHFQLVKS